MPLPYPDDYVVEKPKPSEQLEYQRFKQEVDARIAEARSSFEAQIQAERERALQQYQGQIPAQIEATLAAREAEARAQFEKDIAEQQEAAERSFLRAMSIKKYEAEEQFRQAWLGISATEQAKEQQKLAESRARMRVETARAGLAYSPRQIIEYEAERASYFREQMASAELKETTKFKSEMAEWETTERKKFAESLAEHLMDTRASFETGLEAWRAEQRTELTQKAESLMMGSLTAWEKEHKAALETSISKYLISSEAAWQQAIIKYQGEIEAFTKAEEQRVTEFKASLPKDYVAMRVNGDWVGVPEGYMPPEKQPDGTYIAKPPPQGYNYDPVTKQLVPYAVAVPLGEYDIMVATAVVLPFLAPKILPAALGITTAKIATGALINVAVGEVASYVMTGQPLPVEAIPYALVMGEVLPVVTAGITAGVGTVVPKIVESLAGRTFLSAGIGAGYSYVLSGFKPEEAVKGAVFGAAFSLGWELVAQPLTAQIKLKLGLAKPLYEGEPTLGKTGEDVGTWISEPVEALGGKRIRIVSDVTELPVGAADVTRESMIMEYVGRRAATAHATLTPKYFELGAGETTEIIGIPSRAAGWRSYKEWYHFYSAPSVSEEYITIYGGYMGVGEGYSGVSPRIVMGGRATALVTTETYLTPKMMPVAGEGMNKYLSRVSTTMGGLTGLDPALVLGVVGERQVITPASYIRKGEATFGSLFISEGKAGQFIIQELPKGLLGEIPILRSMFSKYTTMDVIVGSFAPAEYKPTGKPAALAMAGMGERVISVPSVSVISSAAFIFTPSPATRSLRAVSSPAISAPSVPSLSLSYLSAPSKPVTTPSKPSVPSKPSGSAAAFIFSTPSKPYKPSIPSVPSYMSTPSEPSEPSVPSLPSYPSAPSYPSTSVGSLILSPPSRKIKKGRRLKKRVTRYAQRFDRYGEIFPIKTESEVAEYVFGEFQTRSKSLKKRNSRRHKR